VEGSFFLLGLIVASPAFAESLSKAIPARVEAIPIQTITISDEQFLKGNAYGRPTTIAGTLRIAQGSGPRPLVIIVAGSGGHNANTDVWDRQFGEMGISSFALDAFAGRGIVSTVVDQSQLGRLNMILDIYRSLEVLAAHPLVDPTRIAVIGFSRGGQAALYASLTRFQKMWNPGGVDLAAYIALYPTCNMTFMGDTEVSDHPVRIFHGISNDYEGCEDDRISRHLACIRFPNFSGHPNGCKGRPNDASLHVARGTRWNHGQCGNAEAVHLWR
jgi:dienelactone hydrolase